MTTCVDPVVGCNASNFLPERAQGNKQEVLYFLWAHKSDSHVLWLCYYYYFVTLKGRCPQMMVSISKLSWRESVIVSHCFCGSVYLQSERLFPHLAAAPFAFVTKSPTSSSLSLRRYRLSVKWCPLQLYLHHLARRFFLRQCLCC